MKNNAFRACALSMGMFLLAAAPGGRAMAAGEEESTQAWSFERLVRESLSYPSILAGKSGEQAALADLSAAKWQRFPVPGVQVTSQDMTGGGSSDGSSDETSAIFSLEQPLWTGGLITAGIDGAEARHRFAGDATRETEEGVLLDVVDAYVEALRRQEHQEIHRDNVKQHERLLAMIERRAAQKVSPEVDQDLARSRLHQTVGDLASAGQMLNNALTRLSELAGSRVERVAPYAAPEAALPANRPEALRLAREASPTLSGLRYKESAAGADVDAARAAWWPRIALRAEAQTGAVDDNRIYLTAQTQLDAGLASLASVDSAVAKRQAVAHERDGALRDLTVRVYEAWDQLVAARIRLENAGASSETARKVFESYARQFTVGQKSWLDVLNATREAALAQVTLEDARAETRQSELRIHILTGQLHVQ
ncbi:MAG: TolC family protein [Magnetococcales bacterium]|nr:TolC family protein [Magnetococcales bacterium]